MIIRRVELTDFGIYGGEHVFDLAPVPLNGFNRPIILLSGKNGAGKTTLIEAIRLCLHGSLAIGSRVSRATYDSHLVKRIHVPLNSAKRPMSAKVGVLLDYVSVGRKQVYYIERSWYLVRERVKQTLRIWEGDQELVDFDTDRHKESFLRELVPPPMTDIFFFDGERLQMLALDGTSNGLLADTVKTLFGLNLVEQLQKDLDIYLSRKIETQDADSLQDELQQITLLIADLEGRLGNLQTKKQANRESMTKTQRMISYQEQRIASEGRWFAERLENLRSSRQRLEVEMELRYREAQEMCSGLVPFAIAPEMCRRVAERLLLEKEYERGVATEQVLEDQLARIQAEVNSAPFWADMTVALNEPDRKKLLARIEATLKRSIPSHDITSQDVILQVSDQDRQVLLGWVSQALSEVPQQLCRVVTHLNLLGSRLQQVDQELELVPSDEALRPLVEELHGYNQKFGKLQMADEDLAEQIRRVEYELEQTRHRLRQLRQQLAQREHHDQRIQLATRTQLVLEDYVQELGQEKVGLLEKAMLRRFNDLSRKESLVDAVKIDPDTYESTLYRRHQPFERSQLSAGEKQILAMATIWALREVSRIPMPVIIDTPLGRLDSDHRLSMVQDYFPRASHQVVLLATDTEIDSQMVSRLAPAISRIYYLTYDPEQGRTKVRETIPSNDFSSEEAISR
jgi:DNA sulfur modification protein DndD